MSTIQFDRSYKLLLEKKLKEDEATKLARKQKNQITNRRTAQKPPPITVQNSTIKSTISMINRHQLSKEGIILRQVSGLDNVIGIQTNTIDSYNKIIKALKEELQEFYTYTPKSAKIKSIVLKGLIGDFSEEEILKELKYKNFNNVTITRVTKIKFIKVNNAQYHFLVQISEDSHISELTRTKYIYHQAVRWEHLKKNIIFQCKNCQRLGHASSNCHLKFRCVKCSLNHEPGKCTITRKTDVNQLKCANCGKEGHPASYRGCLYIKFVTKLVNEVKKATISNKIQRKVSSGISYSAIRSRTFKNTPSAPNTPNNMKINKSNHQQKSNDLPPWVDMFKQGLLNIDNRLATIEKQLHNNNCKIDSLFEILWDSE